MYPENARLYLEYQTRFGDASDIIFASQKPVSRSHWKLSRGFTVVQYIVLRLNKLLAPSGDLSQPFENDQLELIQEKCTQKRLKDRREATELFVNDAIIQSKIHAGSSIPSTYSASVPLKSWLHTVHDR